MQVASVQVTSPAELREALQTAPPGAVIELAPGEYGGPFVLTRPVTLRGHNRQTVLWRRGGPVIDVHSAGIRLEKLLIERTVQSGPLVIHRPGCAPVGKESMETDTNTLIDLGELLPGSNITLSLELDVSAHTEISATGLYGVRVSPAVLEAGTHRVSLTVDGNAILRGEILLGEVTLREGDQTRYLWISGVVAESSAVRPLPAGQVLCLAHRKLKLYPSASGLYLEGAQLTALELGNLPTGECGFVQRETGGLLSLFVNAKAPAEVRLNDQPVPPNSRRLLRQGDRLLLDEVAFTIEAAEPMPVEIPDAALTFADFDTRFPDALILTVRTPKAAWRGRVITATPWLSVQPEGYFRVPPGRNLDWAIALNEEALALADGQHTGALLIEGAGQAQVVDVRLNVHRPPVALQVQPLDLGEIEWGLLEAAEADGTESAGRVHEIRIANVGRSGWAGTLHANVPWLHVDLTAPLSGSTWSEVVAQVRFAPDWAAHGEMLSVGAHDFPDALVVRGTFPDQLIPVRVKLLAPRGHLEILNSPLHFDEVERNAPLPTLDLRLRNRGGSAWVGQVRALNGWTQIDGNQIAPINLPPGESAELEVGLVDVPPNEPLDQILLIDYLQFEVSEGAPVAAPVPVHMTIVQRPPFLVARLVSFPPFVWGDPPPEAALHIHNMGPSIWQGQIIPNLKWLNAPQRAFECEPSESITVAVGLNFSGGEALKAGISLWENALRITGGREPISVAVQLDIRETPEDIHLETPTLNFGMVTGGENAPEVVRLLNAGPNAWGGLVTLNVPWLSFESAARNFEIEIPKMSVIEFKVFVNERALDLPSGVVSEDHALSILARNPTPAPPPPPARKGQRGAQTSPSSPIIQPMRVRAMLVTAESAPRLAVSPRRLKIGNGKAGEITVRNEGTRRWSLQVNAVAWLKADPAEFALNAGQSQRVSLSPEGGHAALPDPRAVVIVGPGREVGIEVEPLEPLVPPAPAEAPEPAAPVLPAAPPEPPARIDTPDRPEGQP